MANLPPSPFQFAASDAAADTAVVSLPHAPAPDAAATHFDSGAHAVCTSEEAVASFRQTSDAAAEFPTDMICEIFAGARKLFDPDPAAYTREDELYYDVLKAMDDPHTADLIEMPYGMEGLFDRPPLFLQQAAG